MRSLLYNLRCKSVRGIKDNFHRQFKEDLSCPLKCLNEIDTQEHLLHCHGLVPSLSESQQQLLKTVKYSDIFGSIDEQVKIVGIFQELVNLRKRLLTNRNQQSAYPRAIIRDHVAKILYICNIFSWKHNNKYNNMALSTFSTIQGIRLISVTFNYKANKYE